MTTIDHKALSEALLAEAAEQRNAILKTGLLQAAQVHATLYAGDMHRVSSLIEWLGDGALSEYEATRTAQVALSNEITNTLGLS